MSITAAILLIGACGSASRTMTVEPSIEAIVIRVVAGGMNDCLLPVLRGRTAVAFGDRAWSLPALQVPGIRIDGRPRTGVIAWAAAAYRVAGYIIRDRMPTGLRSDDSGSVEYSYRLTVRGFNVWRTTRITDGRVVLTTDVWGSIAEGKLYHVRLTIIAVEGAHGTRITGVATGDSEIGKNCRIISRIASRIIADELDTELLARIQSGGVDLYRAGSIAEVLR